jgi:transcriptional regulator with XRE-family HTH domain
MIDFYQLRLDAGFTRKSLSEYLSISQQTVRNWDRKGAPVTVVKLLQLLANDLSHLGSAWSGFYFYNGELKSPEGDYYRAGDIRAIPYLRMTSDFQAEEISRLKNKARSWRRGLVVNLVAK